MTANSDPSGDALQISGYRAPWRLGRNTFITATIAATLVWFTRQFVIEGWLVPVRVSGASMAPSLLGEHYQIECVECGFEFVVANSEPPRTGFVRCPNCSSEGNAFAPSTVRRGDRVWIEKWPLLFRSPRRWEAVVVDDPDGAERFVVIRVVGLPGETVQIIDGDVRVNGHTVPRSLGRQRQMAWVVNDDRYRRTLAGHAVSRWRPARPDSRWHIVPHGFEIANPKDQPDRVDWLVYQHVAAVTGSLGKPVENVVLDDIALNQTARRTLHTVSDLALSGHCQTSGVGQLMVRHETGNGVRLWTFDFSSHEVTLRSQAEVLGSAAFPRQPFRFRIGSCDGEAGLWIDDQVVLVHPFAPGEAPGGGTSRPFALGSRALQATMGELCIERDTYVTVDSPRPVEGSWQLGDDEFFLLGDNSPVSHDSRHWSNPVRRRHVRGIARRRASSSVFGNR